MRKLIFVMLLGLIPALASAGDFVRPDYLKPGDRVAVISASFYPDMLKVQLGINELHRMGFEPVAAPNLGKRCRGNGSLTANNYAGTVEERTSDLVWALEDESIKAIICARGGYGAMHLLQTIPVEMYSNHPKWIIGYSDVTALHAACIKAGVMSLHAPTCSGIGSRGAADKSNKTLIDLLYGTVPSYDIKPHPFNSYGHAEGRLVGGNMITWEVLAGTGYDMLDSGEELIIFIEEVEETMHACDRLFNMILMSGKMSRIKGIVFGEFTDCIKDLPYGSVEEMLYQYTAKLGIPVCCGFPAGHGRENFPIVEGAKVSLDVTEKGSQLKFIGL